MGVSWFFLTNMKLSVLAAIFIPSKAHWKTLGKYINNVDAVLAELRLILEKVAVDRTVIVMTCNMGQSELLINFVCTAKERGLDLNNVLVFPTDRQTKEISEGLGLATYYDARVSTLDHLYSYNGGIMDCML